MPMSFAAVVLCAGKGTRMKSDRAKVLHPILGRPLCSYSIARALEIGAFPVVAVVGHQGDAVKEAVGKVFPGASLRFAIQKDQRGTADAVRAAQEGLTGYRGPVMILYGDTPLITSRTLRALLDKYEESG